VGVRPDQPDDPGPHALVAAALACLDAAFTAWVAREGNIPMSVMLDRAMAALTT
jgi:hypothetical protein